MRSGGSSLTHAWIERSGGSASVPIVASLPAAMLIMTLLLPMARGDTVPAELLGLARGHPGHRPAHRWRRNHHWNRHIDRRGGSDHHRRWRAGDRGRRVDHRGWAGLRRGDHHHGRGERQADGNLHRPARVRGTSDACSQSHSCETEQCFRFHTCRFDGDAPRTFSVGALKESAGPFSTSMGLSSSAGGRRGSGWNWCPGGAGRRSSGCRTAPGAT